MPKAKAFIFDLNGTMIDDMRYHSAAWYAILNEDLNAGLTHEEVDRQMYGKNEELLDRVFGKGRFGPQELAEISRKKELSYQAAFRPHLALISGLPEFLEKASRHHIRMGIGTAAIPFNIDFVLDNLPKPTEEASSDRTDIDALPRFAKFQTANPRHTIRAYFGAIVSADDVKISKPDPETFLKAAEILGVAPEDCVVFEDAPKGVEAALRAGMRSVVLTTMHQKEEFSRYSNVVRFITDYTDPSLEDFFV